MDIQTPLIFNGFAFYLSLDSESDGHRILGNLALKHQATSIRLSVGPFSLTLVSHRRDNSSSTRNLTRGTFTIGSAQYQTSDDRHSTVVITENKCKISVDHFGTVPIYFRQTQPIAASNILLTLGADERKLSRAGLYALLRLGHPIWNETAWDSIGQLTPDSFLSIDAEDHSHQVISTAFNARESAHAVGATRSRRTKQLRDLNVELVRDSLENQELIVLPLSSGYDSRMILAALSDSPALRERTVAMTYGPSRGIEVTSAKALASDAGVRWCHVQIDSDFLTPNYLSEVAEIFGASLPMHAMYQIKFWEQVCKVVGPDARQAVLTSGFMTGVPAGQHVSKMASANSTSLGGLTAFAQSKWWTKGELQTLGFDHSDETILQSTVTEITQILGESARASVWFDSWTRQRNFISYYPRFFEWKAHVHSPHHARRYIDFFQTIPISELQDRRLVEELFQTFYWRLSRIPSDSNLWRGLGGPIRRATWATRILLPRIVPQLKRMSFWDSEISFDKRALQDDKNDPLWGLDMSILADLWPTDIGKEGLMNLVNGLSESLGTENLRSYYKLTSLQSICLEKSVRSRLLSFS